MSDDLHTKVTEHESKLVRVEVILERVASNQDQMADAVRTITDSMVKQELLLEKLTNLEANTKDSIGRVHKRIDSVEDTSNEKHSATEKKLSALDFLITMANNPKMTMFIVGALYLVAIEDIRKAVMG